MADTLKLTDVTGHELELELPVRRVVSLVPSVTESIFGLGCEDVLAGRTRYCIAPDPDVRKIAKFGGTKDPDIPGIVTLKPDLVLANREENRKVDIDALRDAGINVYVDEPTTVQEGLAMVALLGRIFEQEDAANEIVAIGARTLNEVAERLAERDAQNEIKLKRRKDPRPRVAAFIWHEPWMVAGGHTYISDMIETLGGLNVFANSTLRYFALDPVDIAAKAPDILLFPDEPYSFTDKDIAFWRENFEGMPAVAENRLRKCSGQDLCWYGTRIPAALLRLQPALAW
ncbi:MAG: ABC transporter substrate-binding protein [Planctomycetes bacterium]|nr:ABC transporter substrate-binding protein [Planctomycetota bacterium]